MATVPDLSRGEGQVGGDDPEGRGGSTICAPDKNPPVPLLRVPRADIHDPLGGLDGGEEIIMSSRWSGRARRVWPPPRLLWFQTVALPSLLLWCVPSHGWSSDASGRLDPPGDATPPPEEW